jgi:hypothetical protein
MVATAGLELDHVPPLTPSVRLVVPPVHTLSEPLIEPAEGLDDTVNGKVVIAVPQVVVTE